MLCRPPAHPGSLHLEHAPSLPLSLCAKCAGGTSQRSRRAEHDAEHALPVRRLHRLHLRKVICDAHLRQQHTRGALRPEAIQGLPPAQPRRQCAQRGGGKVHEVVGPTEQRKRHHLPRVCGSANVLRRGLNVKALAGRTHGTA
eukprot:350930-Chlamydomonas_euryale.AAC.2